MKKSKERKANLKMIAIIGISFLILASIILVVIFLPLSENPRKDNSITNHSPAPAFRKDGTLSILKKGNNPIIPIDIEIADEEAERIKGLMDRFSLPEMAGMLFVFENEEPRSFWMKNTYISLDIIFINSNKEIVSIQKYTQPQTTTSIPSDYPAQYVLEVNAGFSDNYEINPGDIIDFQY